MEHTSLFLNGPKLGIVTSPQDLTGVIGIATFTGISTASFPTSSDGVNDGSIELKWYYDGSRILDTSEDSTSNASIVGFTSALGYGSTITITGLDVYDNDKEVYFAADYVPTAYSQPIGTTVTAGTARSTGNAYNELLKSEIATIGIYPIIEITSQPEDVITVSGQAATYSVDARKHPGGGNLSFQWQFDNEDLSDGSITSSVDNVINPAATITITGDNGSSVSLDSSQVSTYDGFVTGVTYTIVATANVTTKCYAVGGAGGSSIARSVAGGGGGSTSGTFTFLKDQTYKLRVGGRGNDGGSGGYSGGGAGGGGWGSGQGGGGGFTGLFIDSISQSNAILIAAGGGGGANDPATGGGGGGLTGGDGSNTPHRAGKGGTQSAGGAAGTAESSGQAGSALQGGSGAAGGGGGYYGGGGGGLYSSTCCGDGAGGGGSSFLHSTLISDGETTSGSLNAPKTDGSFRFEIINTTDTTTLTRTISGSKTKTLSITVNSSGSESSIGSIRCKVTSDEVQKSPVYSRSASWVVIHRNLLKYEVVNEETAVLSHVGEKNLDDGAIMNNIFYGGLKLSYSDLGDGNLRSLNNNSEEHPRNQLIIVYAPEKDIPVIITIAGAIGSENAHQGGDGGVSSFEFVLRSNTEYVFALGPAGVNPSPGGGYGGGGGTFFYRGSQLIACVGGGGGGGPCGLGGNGGGIDLPGGNGTGSAAGTGAVAPLKLFSVGFLPTRGHYPGGSETEYTPYKKTETAMNGGRVSACTWGSWYINRAYSPCTDIGTVHFRGNDGTENTSTALLKRSYKAGPGGGSAEEGMRGWIYRLNGGNGGWGPTVGNNGDGGGGAIGGQGGHRSHSGGGGGSGFSNGEATSVLELPVNPGSSYFKIELIEDPDNATVASV